MVRVASVNKLEAQRRPATVQTRQRQRRSRQGPTSPVEPDTRVFRQRQDATQWQLESFWQVHGHSVRLHGSAGGRRHSQLPAGEVSCGPTDRRWRELPRVLRVDPRSGLVAAQFAASHGRHRWLWWCKIRMLLRWKTNISCASLDHCH